MELSEAFKILEGDPELQCKYGNDGDGCINPQIAKDEAILTIKNYIEFQTIPKKKIKDKLNELGNIEYISLSQRNTIIYAMIVLQELLEK